MSQTESTDTLHGRRATATPLSDTGKTAVALCATWVAGFVDATGYLLLSHIYTSNMTGNTIEVAIKALHGDWAGVMQRGWPILMFVAGLVLGAVFTEVCVRRSTFYFSAMSLGFEAILLAAFVVASPKSLASQHTQPPPHFLLLIAFLAVGMGLQNQTLSRIGGLTFRTTHVTGNITKLGAELSLWLFWLHDESRSPRRFIAAMRQSPQRPEFRKFSMNVQLWVWFVLGALCAVYGTGRWRGNAVIAPVAFLLALVAIDIVRPIAASAELKEIENQN